MEKENNKVNLCDSCCNEPPKCFDDAEIVFGDGAGGDNICCCNCYEPLMTRLMARSEK